MLYSDAKLQKKKAIHNEGRDKHFDVALYSDAKLQKKKAIHNAAPHRQKLVRAV